MGFFTFFFFFFFKKKSPETVCWSTMIYCILSKRRAPYVKPPLSHCDQYSQNNRILRERGRSEIIFDRII
jgi:hypothetical protein